MHRPDDKPGQHRHRQLMGYVGLLLPIAMIPLVLWRDGSEVWRRLESISAYYYTGANAAFVGMLVAFALFLFTYDGYRNRYHTADLVCAWIGGIAALGVAFFPTAAPEGMPALVWWQKWMGQVHHAAAIALFVVFAIYCLWLFRLTDPAVPSDDGKPLRNKIYFGCGLGILICIAWAGTNAWQGQSIWLPEALALFFFAVSWLVKGYFLKSIAHALGLASAADDEDLAKS